MQLVHLPNALTRV